MSENKVVANLPTDSPPPERTGGLIEKVQAIVDRGRAFLLGYDLFISYRRADANAYALRLADRLTKLGFRCYLDQFSSSADRELPEDVKYALRQSAGLVIVGSPGALESKAIAEEVAIFSKLSRTILPVSVAGALKDGTWGNLITGISRTDEVKEALDKDRPSRQVLTRLSDSANFRRRNEQLKRTFLATLAAIAIVIIAGAGAAEVFRRQATKARVDAQDALKSRDEAVNGAKAAEEQRVAAVSKLNKAQGELSTTQTQLGQAITDRDTALESVGRAQEQERVARAEAGEQTKIAGEQRREAQKQGEIALSRKTLADAQREMNGGADPFRKPLSLAVEAYQKYPSSEPDALIRKSIERVPRRVANTPMDENIAGLAYGPDGSELYAVTPDKVYVLDPSTGVERQRCDLSQEKPIGRLSMSENGQTVTAIYSTGEGGTSSTSSRPKTAKNSPLYHSRGPKRISS